MPNQTIYRLQSAHYGLPKDFITGKGAELTGGRWNAIGVPVVYTSMTVELASLEYLIHYFDGFPSSKLPPLLLASITIPTEAILTIEAEDLPLNWQETPAPKMLQQVSNQWIHSAKYVALKLPTAVHSVRTEWSYNVLLNPLHPSMNTGLVTKIEPFYFDTRYQIPQIQGTVMQQLLEDILGKE